jgi:hypothetical protein
MRQAFIAETIFLTYLVMYKGETEYHYAILTSGNDACISIGQMGMDKMNERCGMRRERRAR